MARPLSPYHVTDFRAPSAKRRCAVSKKFLGWRDCASVSSRGTTGGIMQARVQCRTIGCVSGVDFIEMWGEGVAPTTTLEDFAQAYEVLRRYIRRHELEEKNGGISRVQAMIVRHLHLRGARTVGQLAEHLAVRPSTMSQMIDRLQLAGMVDRVADPHDARVRLVELTAAGKDVVQSLKNLRLTLLTGPWGKLTATEQEAAAALLTKLAHGLPNAPDEI